MTAEVRVTLDPVKNKFVVRVGKKTIPLSPREFEKLIQESIGAAAIQLNTNFEETGIAPKKNDDVEALTITAMEASADLGAVHIITKVRLGVLSFNLAGPRQSALDYCGQVLRAIAEADSQSTPPQMM